MPEGELYRRAYGIAERAFEQPAAARRALVDEACAGDEALFGAVLELLAGDRDENFLEKPLIRGWEEAAEQAWIGRFVGPYRLSRLLGAGGCSRVYLGAREEGELAHQVAVKLLRSNVDGSDAVRRFRTERQVLASLDHPGIARFIDAGTTEDGVPFLVMEYVHGSRITEYCDTHRLTVAQRLRLFVDVCRAVQSAHQRLVVHRDLKPSNVLVTAEGETKLLDFGVSKLLGAAARDDETATGDRAMTPGYASPEQLAGELVTTASDVYSLGVVLYELLTGGQPARGDAEAGPDLSRPSVGAGLDTAAAARSVSLGALRRQLRGDLDAIVVKALREDPAERYPSVEQLAEDVGRHLAGLPVLATGPRLGYRLRKFVGRNRAAVAASVVAAAALVGLVLSSLVHSARLADERDRAQLERRRAEEVTRFLVRSFELADPGQASGPSLTAREVVERAAQRISVDLAGQPQLEAEILTTLGVVYRGIGLYQDSVRLLERALELRRAHAGEGDPAAGSTRQALALSLGQAGDFEAAEVHARAALLTHRGRDEEATVDDLGALAFALWGQMRLDEAEEAGREALTLAARVVGGDPFQLVEAQANLAVVLEHRGRYDEAEQLHRGVLATLRGRYGEDHPGLVIASNNLAWLLQEKGELEEAERLQRRALEAARRVFGQQHPQVAVNLNHLGLLLQKRGDLEGAATVHREAIALRRAALGEQHPAFARSMHNLALVLAQGENIEGATEIYLQALALFRRTLGPEHPETANAASNLGVALARLGRFDEAERYLEEALEVRRRRLGDEHLDVGATYLAMARVMLATDRPREAQGLAERADAIYVQRLGEEHWRTALVRGVLGVSLSEQGDPAAAEPLLVRSLEMLQQYAGISSNTVQWQLRHLVDLYTDLGEPQQAAQYREQLAP